MSTFESRQFELLSSLGDRLFLKQLKAREALGELSNFELICLSKEHDVPVEELLGKKTSVRIGPLNREDEDTNATHRYLTGYVTNFSFLGSHGPNFQAYRLVIQPWPFFLTRTNDFRIFQNQSVPEIVQVIFADHQGVAEFRIALCENYSPREYCVQYRESDFDFVCRLMEEEGIYFFFEYTKDGNVLVLADGHASHKDTAGTSPIPLQEAFQGNSNQKRCIRDWRYEHRIQPGKYHLIDFDFKRPKLALNADSAHPRKHEHSSCEQVDYPGKFEQPSEGEKLARTRLEQHQTRCEFAHAYTNVHSLCLGEFFTLEKHPRAEQNREYLVTETWIEATEGSYEAGDTLEGEKEGFLFEFTALDGQQVFRPQRKTPKPYVRGPQTAIVVGPAGDEIYTDQYGRVKVQFHWDRLGKKDENSSCWMRVSTPWAGKNWGFISIPRIGQEVVVEFLEGDPDRPLITGSVYNGEQMPPYALPENMTQSGIKTRSSKGGTLENFNEIRFEDKKGAEQLIIHAEKDQSLSVENDESHSVGHNRSKTVDNDETVHIKHDRKETVDNNETITIGANRTKSVGADEKITINANLSQSVGANEKTDIGSNRTVTIGSNDKLDVGGSIKQTATGEIQISSSSKMTLSVLGSTVELTPTGITLSFGISSIKLNAMGVAISGPKISLNG